ncbi:MAG: hypothetical protein J5654_01210 [Victivallales bacterium]|nr:hypothetical protein [Victivallales bacterium]
MQARAKSEGGQDKSFAIASNALIIEWIQNHRGDNRNQQQAAMGGAFIDVGNFAPKSETYALRTIGVELRQPVCWRILTKHDSSLSHSNGPSLSP